MPISWFQQHLVFALKCLRQKVHSHKCWISNYAVSITVIMVQRARNRTWNKQKLAFIRKHILSCKYRTEVDEKLYVINKKCMEILARCQWRFQSSGIWCHVAWYINTSILEEYVLPIFRVAKEDYLFYPVKQVLDNNSCFIVF